jgi:hypothetical protein
MVFIGAQNSEGFGQTQALLSSAECYSAVSRIVNPRTVVFVQVNRQTADCQSAIQRFSKPRYMARSLTIELFCHRHQ